MARMLLLVAMLVASLVAHARVGETDQKTMSKAKAERQARRDAYAAEIDGIVRSRNYIFRPIMMQNVVTGNTRSVFAYYLYAALAGDKVVLHLPVEFTSYLIDTVNIDSYIRRKHKEEK